MTTPMKILGGLGVVVGIFAFKKKTDYTKVIESMTWNIFDIRNLRTAMAGGNWKLFFDMDITFHNNTKYDFDLDTAGYIYLRRIIVLHKGTPLGEATSNTTKIVMPPYGHYTVTGIQVEVSILDALNQIVANGLDTNPDNYSARFEIDALGQTFFINKQLAV